MIFMPQKATCTLLQKSKTMLSQRGIDVEQEYLCKASTSSNSVFAAITDSDRGDFGDWETTSKNENDVNDL